MEDAELRVWLIAILTFVFVNIIVQFVFAFE